MAGWLLAAVLGGALYVMRGMLKATQEMSETHRKSRAGKGECIRGVGRRGEVCHEARRRQKR